VQSKANIFRGALNDMMKIANFLVISLLELKLLGILKGKSWA